MKQLLCNIVIPNTNHPRQKLNYIGNQDDDFITFILADDFQEDVKRQLKLTIDGSDQRHRFPMTGSCSLVINVSTSQEISLIGVLKNILDSCNGLLYTDDCHVESIVINKSTSENATDDLRIDVLTNMVLRVSVYDAGAFEAYKVLDLDVHTILEDRFYPYPTAAEIVQLFNPNSDDDEALKGYLTEEGPHPPINDAIEVSIVTDTLAPKADIDNLALNLLVNMEGLIYSSTTQIVNLHIQRQREGRSSTIQVFSSR